jgi:hypothetical protein
MTDLRNVAVIGMMGRLNMLIDEAAVAISPSEVKQWIADGTIFDQLHALYGDYPEFSPVHEAEAILMLKEWKTVLDIYAGREESKMGVSKNGLCLLVGYCIEILMQRNLRELVR